MASAAKSGPGAILAFELEDAGPGGKKKGGDEDVRLDAAQALISAFKSGNAKRFLSALDSVLDLREAEGVEDSLEDLDDEDY
jgi:hypothetical protein